MAALQRPSFLTPSSYGVRTQNIVLPLSCQMKTNCSSSPSSLQLSTDEILIQNKRLEFGQFVAHEALADEEYWTAAWLRAESHWEEKNQDRYVDTYKRKYAEQEYNAIKRRCKAQFGQKCTCVVVTAKNSNVVGTLDLIIGQLLPGEIFPWEMVKPNMALNKIKSKVTRYGYVANLCVAKSERRQGIASNMLHFAIRVIAKANGAELVFVHVHKNNNSAQQLYKKIGFQMIEEANLKVSEEQPYLLCIRS